eukprot:SAG31_NODE_57_length_29727_cov_12.584568_27_plen_122_part_00
MLHSCVKTVGATTLHFVLHCKYQEEDKNAARASELIMLLDEAAGSASRELKEEAAKLSDELVNSAKAKMTSGDFAGAAAAFKNAANLDKDNYEAETGLRKAKMKLTEQATSTTTKRSVNHQ